MRNATVTTNPVPYSKACDTFWAADCTATRTCLGRKSLINFDKRCAPSGAFVFQHMPECAPACIQDRFRHLGFSEAGGIHVSDSDNSILSRDLRACDMQLMAARVGDLGVDRADSALIPGALRSSESFLVLSIVPKCGDFSAVAANRQRFEPKINPNFAATGRQVVGYLASESCIPASARILHECAAEKFAFERPVLPKPETLLEVANAVAFEFDSPLDVWNPTQRFTPPKARAKSWALPVLIARTSEPTTDLRDRIGVQSKFSGTADTKRAQVYPARPSSAESAGVASLCLALSSDAEVPDLIAADREFIKSLAAGAVFDAELEGNDTYDGPALVASGRIKSASSGASQSARSQLYLIGRAA